MTNLIQWVINLPLVFTQFFEWLTMELPHINVSPLALFSVAGITILVGALLFRLFIGG